MTESDFTRLADDVFFRIENAFDDTQIDCALNGGVMEIELEDSAKIIINRHTPNREIWIAAKTGGFHYRWQNDHWRDTRTGDELFNTLGALCKVTF